MRCLIVKLSSMGDVIHALPVVHDILHAYPQAQIDWVVEEAFAELVSAHAGVHQVLPIGLRRWQKNWLSRQHWWEFSQFKQQLQQDAYDFVFDLQGLAKSALIARWARKVRVAAQPATGKSYGFAAAAAKEPWSRYWIDSPLPINTRLPLIEQLRSVPAQALSYTVRGKPEFGLQVPERYLQVRLPVPLGPSQAYAILLHGTAAAYKLWPPQAWRSLAKALHQLGMATVLPWGNEAEHQRAKAIAANIPSAHVMPERYSILQWAAWMQGARVVIGLDTGLSHLAAALAVPTIFLFGATPHWRIAPYWGQSRHNELNRPGADAATPAGGAARPARHITLGQPEQQRWPTVKEVLQALAQLPLNSIEQSLSSQPVLSQASTGLTPLILPGGSVSE
ncbi:lipopolysaccharide heptosyltransferase I [Parvibium lacunae]|uniref:lipopolysaccharide heptosyltransferase I n=1 Tax=Parvibium lacunae TaxID=1888893 RepID=UPI001313E181|nr:lipopolysaccharide heptosyltransferase I [Parvibium lacunae]